MSNKSKAASVSVGVNVFLLITKLLVAFWTGSIGIIAESAHSLFDLFASVLAYLGIKHAEKPSDESHHYGHHKFENLSSLLQALLLTATGGVVVYEAYERIIHPGAVEHSEVGIILMVATIPIAYLTAKYLGHAAHEAGGSHALEADSAHFTTDILASVAVLIGLVLVRVGFPVGDPIAAIIVGIVMLSISIHILKASFLVFMDYSPDPKIVDDVKKIILADKRVRDYHKLKARMAGSHIFLDVHLLFRHNMTVRQAHRISHQVKAAIMRKNPQVADVTIHIEPEEKK